MSWSSLFTFHVSAAELIFRGSVMYWFLFLMFRFVVRRETGSVGTADILLLVIIADAAQNAMAGAYQSIAEGMVLVGTLIGWNVVMDRLAFHFPPVARFVEPRPSLLARRGKILHRNLRRECVTPDELMTQLRKKGIERLADVKEAWMESNGEISVIKSRP